MSATLCEECNQPAELKCSGCKLVAYCSKEHQKLQWKTHKNICRPFEVQTSPELGKHLVAVRDLSPGDLIVCEYPLVFGPRPHPVEEGPVPCPGCCRLIVGEASPRCQGCGWPVCHSSCEGLQDVVKHAHECLLLCLRPARATDNLHDFYRQDTLFALRCLLLQKRGPKKWQQLLEMESHLDHRGRDTEIYNDIETRVVRYIFDNFIKALKELEQRANQSLLPEVSEEILHRICGIIDVNALEIKHDAEISALYPTAVLMEHSCIPNTYHIFDDESQNYKITIRAAVAIKKGEHITTMYTHSLWGTQARREHLRDTKYFSCTCPRCKDPTELGTYITGLRCLGTQEDACGGTQLPVHPLEDNTEWSCDRCPVRLTNDEVAFLVNKIGVEVDTLQISKPTVKELNQILEKMLTFLHPHHYHVYSIKHSLVQLYGYQQGYLPNQISDELLQEKSDMCRDLLEVTKTIDPGNARLSLYSGVLLHELHLANMYYVKRKWHVDPKEDLMKLVKEARDSLLAAKEVLKNEMNTAAGNKLMNLISNTEKEMVKWLERNEEEIRAIKK